MSDLKKQDSEARDHLDSCNEPAVHRRDIEVRNVSVSQQEHLC
jgi:hypothetical protein